MSIKKKNLYCPGGAEPKAKGDAIAPYITDVVGCKEVGRDSKNKAVLNSCHSRRRQPKRSFWFWLIREPHVISKVDLDTGVYGHIGFSIIILLGCFSVLIQAWLVNRYYQSC